VSGGYNSKYVDVDLGLDYIRYKIKGRYDGDNISKDTGVYLTSKVKPLGDDTLYLSLGGRFDHFSMSNLDPDFQDMPNRSKSVFHPSLGVAYLPLEWLKLRANYSEGLRMPSAFEYTGGQGYATYDPNPNLEPEESKTIEFGIDVDYRFLSASLTYFTTDWTNKIVGVPHGGNHNWYTNIQKAKLSGYEFAASADLGEAFDLGFEIRPYLSYTYMTDRVNKDPTQLNAAGTNLLAYVPRWTLAYGVTVRNTDIDLQFNANASIIGDILQSKFVVYPDWSYAEEPIFKHSEMVALDLSLEKGLWEIGNEGLYGKLKLRVEAKNILDSKNEVYNGFPGAGRNFYVGLKFEY
jgi:vitamin B12 transporter